MVGTLCKGCGEVMDTGDIPPFTLCECSSCGAELIIPFKLNHIFLEKFIKKYSVMDIYSGVDQTNDLLIIAMLLDQDEDNFDKLLEIVSEEAKALSELKHVNICPVLDYPTIKGNLCVLSPLMDGYTLGDYSPKDQGLLDVSSVVDILQAAALGIAIAHHQNLIHHNICPENIHIDARGNIRIKNFFLSRVAYRVNQLRHNDKTMIPGDGTISPYFISPEKAESGVEDTRGDIFSFGVVFYYLLTGKYPFQGDSTLETVYSRVRKKKKVSTDIFNLETEKLDKKEQISYISPVTPIKLRDGIHQDISDLIMNMLSYLPAKRPKFSKILAVLNHVKADKAKAEFFGTAQKEMVTTRTRAIPKMAPLTGKNKTPKVKKKKRWGFLSSG